MICSINILGNDGAMSDVSFFKISSNGQYISSCSNLAAFALEISLFENIDFLSFEVERRVTKVTGLGKLKNTVLWAGNTIKSGFGHWMMETSQFLRSRMCVSERIFIMELQL